MAEKLGRKLDAVPDRVDVRDWFFQPRLTSLPDLLVNCDLVPEILDQGNEGACTGYALTAVIQFHLRKRNLIRAISPRMLYEMARHYDEWPGVDYEGSSARGAMIGWLRHGVCELSDWPKDAIGSHFLKPEIARRALETPGGAYYRVMHNQVRDMHAALAESGALYCTLMVHEGWSQPDGPAVDISYVEGGNLRKRRLPTIRRKGRADSGHAVAIVGYTYDGFVIQNSWGRNWGASGYALLPYEDFLLHATDVWVTQLGVPVRTDLWVDGQTTDSMAGLQRASESIPLDQIRPYVIDVGNNGQLSDSGEYWTSEADVTRLFAETIPKATQSWKRKRILLYFHGGLNDEKAAAQRIVAFKNVMLANEIYPLHLMWETGAHETLNGLIRDAFVDPDPRAGGVGNWLSKTRDRLIEAKDMTLEFTVARPGTALWNEMKQNARLTSRRQDRMGALQIAVRELKKALQSLKSSDRGAWELHLVGHSAGSIVIAYALQQVLDADLPLKSLQLMAPAIRVDDFKTLVLPAIKSKDCPQPTMYILSDVGERDDNVGPSGAYGKSLLYLVSNAFEGRRSVPLLGMEKFVSDSAGSAEADAELNALFKRSVDGLPSLVIAGSQSRDNPDPASLSRSESHGGFDNDDATMNSVLYRILGDRPVQTFGLRDLQFGSSHPPTNDRLSQRLGLRRPIENGV